VDTSSEQRLLRLSIGITLLIGSAGVLIGLLTRSQALVFDGMYSLVDVVITVLSLAVSRLLANEGSRRFQFGYYHLEPMVEALGGSILALSCIYAAATAIDSLLTGGGQVHFGVASIWAGVLTVTGLAMAVYMKRHARRLDSTLLALDARSWIISGLLSLALLLGFAAAIALEGTARAGWVPYIDAGVLLAIAVCLLPVPLRATARAIREVMQVAPGDLDERVQAVLGEVVARHGFLDYSSHVAKMGRIRFIEVHILVPADYAFGEMANADRLRNEIAERIGANSEQFWLTIDFTADPRWI
jgi:cation diffusion facilitator family transporter